jgi:putative transposase
MDGKGRYKDNIFVERLWRTVKYEEVYLKAYTDGRQANMGLETYFHFYYNERLHQALGYRTPAEVINGEPPHQVNSRPDLAPGNSSTVK